MIILFFLVLWGVFSMIYNSRDNIRRAEWWRRSYTRAIIESQMGESMLLQSLILQSRQRFQKIIVCRVIARLSHSIYRLDRELLKSISEPLKLESELFRLSSRSRGGRRAQYLALLSYLPLGESARRRAQLFADDRNRMVRFYALMVAVVAAPEAMVQQISGYGERFTSFELSQLVGLVRRGTVVAAIPPLLHSLSENVQLLGLNVVKEFGVTSYRDEIVGLIATSSDEMVKREAFVALCSLHEEFGDVTIRRYIASLDGYQRVEALRYMALEGYSERAIGTLTNTSEQHYFHSLIGLHKVHI